MATKQVNVHVVFEYDSDDFENFSDDDYTQMAIESLVEYPEILYDHASVETLKVE